MNLSQSCMRVHSHWAAVRWSWRGWFLSVCLTDQLLSELDTEHAGLLAEVLVRSWTAVQPLWCCCVLMALALVLQLGAPAGDRRQLCSTSVISCACCLSSWTEELVCPKHRCSAVTSCQQGGLIEITWVNSPALWNLPFSLTFSNHKYTWGDGVPCNSLLLSISRVYVLTNVSCCALKWRPFISWKRTCLCFKNKKDSKLLPAGVEVMTSPSRPGCKCLYVNVFGPDHHFRWLDLRTKEEHLCPSVKCSLCPAAFCLNSTSTPLHLSIESALYLCAKDTGLFFNYQSMIVALLQVGQRSLVRDLIRVSEQAGVQTLSHVNYLKGQNTFMAALRWGRQVLKQRYGKVSVMTTFISM